MTHLSHQQLREKFFTFYKSKGHAIVESAPIVPDNDPTTLFTGSGMQPLIPYLLGEPHPQGTRVADIQKCFRAEDLDEVGVTPCHHTFFEMMGNWSFGDYFKKEQIGWALEFFVKEVGLDVNRLYVSVFAGDETAPKDIEAVETWIQEFKKYGVVAKEGDKYDVGKESLRIFAYDRQKNWWERSGAKAGDPAGPDSEMFYDTGKSHDPAFGEKCHINCDCRKYIEICNNVFMQYQKLSDGSYKPLKQKNVDVGYGFERILMVLNEAPSSFETDLFLPIIHKLEELSDRKYGTDKETDRYFRVTADHIRASVMLMNDGVMPSNKEQGYMLRRIIRRALRFSRKLSIQGALLKDVAPVVVSILGDAYPTLWDKKDLISNELAEEEAKFGKALDKGLKELEHLLAFKGASDLTLTGQEAFTLYETYGFPLELIEEVAKEVNVAVDSSGFKKAFEAHQEKSKSAADVKFKGGLEGTSEMHIKYHTATHLLHKALRDVLGEDVHQMGSNITTERLRFDFNYDKKLTSEELQAIEDLVNKQIEYEMPVKYVDLSKEAAENTGALHFFQEKYSDVVRVYFVGDDLDSAYSKEYCGGPHVSNTRELGHFKISKEEAVARGVRRIKAVLL